MSSPYVYIPENNYAQAAYVNHSHSPYGTPYIPDATLAPPSPYGSGYGGSVPASPNLAGASPLPAANMNYNIAFPGLAGGAAQESAQWDAYGRPRRGSWHGAQAPNPNPWGNNGAGPGGLLFAPQPAHQRRNSFSEAQAAAVAAQQAQQAAQQAAAAAAVAAAQAQQQPFYPPFYSQPSAPAMLTAQGYNNWNPNSTSPWWNRFLQLPHISPNASPNSKKTKQMFIHPWLNGEAFRSDFLFNIALPTFAPLRIVGPQGQTMFLGQEELRQPATYPPIFKLTIKCEKISQWPIELVYSPPQGYSSPATVNIPPITVGDILFTIHRELHRPITQYDWGELSTSEGKKVRTAYLNRCKAAGPQGDVPLQKEGVKRVDFLKEDIWFKGLLRDGKELEKMILVVGH